MRGLAAGGVSLPLLAACGSGSSSTPKAAPAAGASGAKGLGGGSKPAQGLTKTSQIPVGGGAIFPGPQVVVTQPTSGHFKGFSAVCTHAGCLVAQVSGGDIICGCHGSRFSIKDGSVVQGPATAPLGPVGILVSGSSIKLT